MRKSKKIPAFTSIAEEQAFWTTHDSADYLDWNNAKKISLPKLKPSTQTISLRLPEILLADIKQLANKHDIPYQSLMKLLLSRAVAQGL
jgi:predicted DNA binding CopG/RHH family protein